MGILIQSKLSIGYLFILILGMGVCFSGDLQAQERNEEDDQKMESTENQSDKQSESNNSALQEPQQVDTNISDEQLEEYLNVRAQHRKIRQEAIPVMQKAIKDAGLTKQRYRNINQQINGDDSRQRSEKAMGNNLDISDEEMKKFKKAKKKISNLQQEMQKELLKVLEDIQLTRKEIQNIGKAVQKSETLQKELREMQNKN